MFVTLLENKTPKMVMFKGRFQLAHVYSVLDLESTSHFGKWMLLKVGTGA